MPTYDAMMRGYQDAQDRTPWKRAPQSFAEETRHGATPEQDAYWRGWRAAVLDRAARAVSGGVVRYTFGYPKEVTRTEESE